MAKRKKAEYVIEKEGDTDDVGSVDRWDPIPIKEGAEIHSVQDAVKYCRDNELEGTFRVVAIKGSFQMQAEKKMHLQMMD